MSDLSQTTPPTGGTSRSMRWLLVASLGLNLLVVGVVGGWMFKMGNDGRNHPPRLEQIGGPLTRALSHDDRRAIGREIRETAKAQGHTRATQRATFEALITELRADPFDRDSVADHMARQRDILTDHMAMGQSLLLDRLGTMDISERAAYADRLQGDLDRRHSKKKK